MKTLHTAYRVSDLAASLRFYSAVGYEVVGSVAVSDDLGLTMLRFPGEAVVTLELAHQPSAGPVEVGGFSHLVVQVDDLAAYVAQVSSAGLEPGPMTLPGGPDGPQTAWLADPDGYRIELVQWPPGHADGLSDADFR